MRDIFWALAIILMGAGGAVWQVWAYGPDLLADWQLRSQQFSEARGNGKWSASGQCRSHKFAADCQIEFTGAAGKKHTFAYQIAFLGSNNTVAVMQTSRPPVRLTTDLGLNYFWNRLITFAVLVTIFFAMAVAAIIALFKPKKASA